MCEHNFLKTWYRVTWSGNFVLFIEECFNCKYVRQTNEPGNFESSYPSTEWTKLF